MFLHSVSVLLTGHLRCHTVGHGLVGADSGPRHQHQHGVQPELVPVQVPSAAARVASVAAAAGVSLGRVSVNRQRRHEDEGSEGDSGDGENHQEDEPRRLTPVCPAADEWLDEGVQEGSRRKHPADCDLAEAQLTPRHVQKRRGRAQTCRQRVRHRPVMSELHPPLPIATQL